MRPGQSHVLYANIHSKSCGGHCFKKAATQFNPLPPAIAAPASLDLSPRIKLTLRMTAQRQRHLRRVRTNKRIKRLPADKRMQDFKLMAIKVAVR